MNIAIQTRPFSLTPGLEARVHRKMNFAFSRLGAHIRSVAVQLTDINGPKGGVDKRCLITLTLTDGELVVISEQQTDLYRAIDRAMQRASTNVARKVNARKRQRKLKNRNNFKRNLGQIV